MIEVLDLYLKNFARIATGLQVTELYIDFTKLENQFFLFVGKNGTGKTSILHTIHPFAYNSSIGDNVPNAEFIIENEDGEKVIQYRVDDSIYKVRHMYLRKSDDSITVKSFISRDGEELNASGTSGTFEDIVFDIFELDKTYLGLLSLGNTVTGFVEYTGGDRKQLISKIFSKLNVFGRYYKNASQEVRTIKSVLNNVTTKLDQYNGYDREMAKNTICQIDQKIGDLTARSQSLSEEIGSVSQKISSNQEFLQDYQRKKQRFFELLSTIDTMKGRIQTKKDIPTLESDLASLIQKIEKTSIDKGSFELNLKTSLDYVQSLKTDLDETKQMVSKMTSDVDLMELDKTKLSLEAQIASIDIPDNTPELDRARLVRASIFLEELRGLCIDFITEVQCEDIVADTAEKIIKDHTLFEKSEKKYNSLLEKLQQSQYMRTTGIMIKDAEKFEIKSTECPHTEECPYASFYHSYKGMVAAKTGEIDHKIAKQQSEVDLAKDIVTIGRITSRLFNYISKNEDIKILPTEIFNPNTFVKLYMEKREVANMDLMSSFVDLAEDQEKRRQLEEELISIEQKRKNYESLRENYDSLNKRIETIEEKIESAQSSVDYHRKELPAIEENLKSLVDVKGRVEKAISSLKELEGFREELVSLKRELGTMESKSSEIEQHQAQIVSLKKQSVSIHEEIESLRKKKEDIHLKLQTINSLEREQLTLMDQYEEAESIKRAVSPSKGVPLEYIKKYVKGDLIQMVNELLELVYGKSLYIDIKRVVIDETNFVIPYRRNGILVSDISHASDGERAVMSLAFSLSLARITSKKYNILLLDEMDTSLDAYSRGKYIDMIVAYMKLIHSRQVFLISHNSMFDSYPVNILMTSEMNVSDKKNVVKLWKRRKNGDR